MRGRGLKRYGFASASVESVNVAPRAGARIETFNDQLANNAMLRDVAPRAGARIETIPFGSPLTSINEAGVAPRAGARIETPDRNLMLRPQLHGKSLPVRGRGLKLMC